jgi:hypothetical protein
MEDEGGTDGDRKGDGRMDGRFASLAMYPTHPTVSSLSPRYCHCDQIQLLFFYRSFFLLMIDRLVPCLVVVQLASQARPDHS